MKRSYIKQAMVALVLTTGLSALEANAHDTQSGMPSYNNQGEQQTGMPEFINGQPANPAQISGCPECKCSKSQKKNKGKKRSNAALGMPAPVGQDAYQPEMPPPPVMQEIYDQPEMPAAPGAQDDYSQSEIASSDRMSKEQQEINPDDLIAPQASSSN